MKKTMPKFYFKARNARNELIEGARTAGSEKEVISALSGEGLVVFSVIESSEKFARAEKKQKGVKGGSIKSEDVAIFCRQFSTLINAGVTIIDAIEDVGDMSVNGKLRTILKSVSADIRGGNTLSEAMRKYQKTFGRVFVALLAAGERSGKLGRILQDLAKYLEGSVKLRRKVQSASTYPLFVAGFFILALAGIVLFLIPRFKAMFASFGAQLPLPTLIVLNISTMALQNLPFIIVGGGALVAAMVAFYKTDSGRMFFDTLILKLPIFGNIMLRVVFARFFQTLSTLIRSGSDVVSSLEIAAKVADNVYIESKIIQVKNRVVEGSTISDEMERAKVFPRMVSRMTAVGEKSGQLDEMFEKLCDYYTDEVDAAVNSMSSIIEPILIIGIGGIVGLVVIALYLPIFKLGMTMMNK